MGNEGIGELAAWSLERGPSERTVAYLTEQLQPLLRIRERVLLCFHDATPGGLGWLMEQAVLRCGAQPMACTQDKRWKRLLRLAFESKATTILGAPLIALGLTKIQRAYNVPLYIRRVITAGYPCLDWMVDGITRGFDCKEGSVFAIELSGIVAGFSCSCSRGVHLRESEYAAEIVDEEGKSVPDGEVGELVLYPLERPDLRTYIGDRARLVRTPCKCGCTAPRLMDMVPGGNIDPDLMRLGQELQSWTSILDCRLNKGDYGLEMEILAIPGEKLPKLPSAAKWLVRPFDPEEDEPFWYVPYRLEGNQVADFLRMTH